MADLTFTIDVDADDAINSAKNLQDEIRDLFTKPTSGKLENQLDKVRLRINKIITQQEKAKASMAKLETKDFGNTGVYQKVLDKIELYSRQVEAAKKNVQAMEKLGAGSAGFQNATEQLEKYKSWLDLYERLKLRMEKQGKAKISPQDTQEWQNYVNKIENGNNEIRTLISAYNQLLARNSEWGEQAGSTAAKTEKRFSKLIEVIKKIPGLLARGIKNLGKFGSKMLGINKASEKHNMSLKKMINQVLRYGLGIRSLFILWRKLRAYTADALKLMATQFEEVNADVSALMNSFNQMKLSFGTMAQPLMHALAPALIYIIELITRAMTALANFFAILTGQKYIYKAQKANDSYADSIKGVGGAAKEANKELAEYDNLLVIDQPKDSGGGGGGGAADGLTGTFEKTLAESDFAKELKAAIEKGDWEGVGIAFGRKINIITETFDNWINSKFRPAGKKWAKRIARILNGLVGEWNSSLAGKTLADGLNAILDIYNTWLTTFDFKKLGTKLKDGIKGFLDNMDPKLLGTTLANKINAMVDFATGLLTDFPWAQTGAKLGTALKTFFETVKWQDIGADLTSLASGILTALSTFIKESNLGVTVGTAINEFLNGIDFKQLATDLSDCAKSIIGAIADLIKTIDWYEVGKAIADLLTNIDWIGLAVELGKVALALIKGLAQALLGLASNPEALADIATALLAIFGAKWVWGKVKSVFSEGLGTALSGAVGDNGLWGKIKGLFKKNTTTAVTEGVSEATSDSGAVAQASGACNGFLTKAVAGIAAYEIGGKVGADLVSGIFGALGASDEYLEEVKKYGEAPITYTANAIKETIAYAFEDTTKGIPDAVEMLAKEINQAMLQGTIDYQGVMDKIQEVPEKYRDTLIQVADETQATLDKIHQNQQKFGNDTVETTEKMNASWSDYADNYNKTTKEVEADNKNIEKSFYTMTDYVPPAVKEAMEQTADNVEKALEPVPGTVANVGTGAYMSLTTPFDATGDLFKQRVADINSAFAPLPNDLGATSASALQSVQTNFATDALTGHFTTVKDNIETPFKSLPSFFSDTFKQSWNEAESAFSSGNTTFNNFNAKLSEGMTNTINGLIGGLNSAVSGPLQKIQEVINKFKNVKIGASSLFSNLPSFSNIPHIPKLAQGAVIPPNREFLAMLGDQTSGTNIETPLATMVQAFKSALSEMGGSSTNQNIVLQLDGRTVAQCVWDEEDKRYKQTGRR